MEKSTMNQEQPSNKRLMTPRSINDSLSYQEDSVVSRELIHTSTGSVTLFAFDKNQGLSEHTTPYDAFVMITDGQAEVTVSGVKHEIKAGDMLLMPASSPHALKAIEPFKMILIMIKS
jgi:quercetin dioxygenase-like cupin family protein